MGAFSEYSCRDYLLGCVSLLDGDDDIVMLTGSRYADSLLYV